jgi:hypothetical protein
VVEACKILCGENSAVTFDEIDVAHEIDPRQRLSNMKVFIMRGYCDDHEDEAIQR